MFSVEVTKKEIAECVGLWLAEGDHKTKREITFTNNCFELILFFHEIISSLYSGNNQPRLYTYSPTTRIFFSKLENLILKNYMDLRANRTYHIYRLADTKFLIYWKDLVAKYQEEKDFYPEILRGIFAGEGNVKHDFENKNSHNLRIASGVRDSFIEKLLLYFGVPVKFDAKHRMYWITGGSLYLLDKINIASLHPEKEAKFRKMINSVKEKHYSQGELKRIVLSKLDVFRKTKDLALELNKSELGILEVLTELKNEQKIDNLKINGVSFWGNKELKEKHFSQEKLRILHNLKKYPSITQMSKAIDIYRKSITSRLEKYKQEGLVVRLDKNHWEMTEKGRIIVGVDESGSES